MQLLIGAPPLKVSEFKDPPPQAVIMTAFFYSLRRLNETKSPN